MKFLSTLSFSLWTPLLLLFNLTNVSFQVAGQSVENIPLDAAAAEYSELYNLCLNSPGSKAFVGVLYASGFKTTFNFDQCAKFVIDGDLVQMVVFCKAASCYAYPNAVCVGGPVPPAPIPMAKGLLYVNAGDISQTVFGQSVICQPNGLP